MRIFSVLAILMMLASAALAQEATETPIDLTPPVLGEFKPASVEDIVVEEYPVLPEVTNHAREIYARGQENGQNAQIFSKIGDCMTASEYFLAPFGGEDYDLGEYEDLQDVIGYFSAMPARPEGFTENSFSNPGLATASGFNTISVLDSIWADPTWCSPNESPLACEYRVSRAAYALVMFGTNDVFFFDAPTFDYYLRTIILETINNNIVPVMYTIPLRPEYPEKTEQFNQIIIRVALDYDLPLVNLNRAIAELPDMGVDPVEPIHLSIPEDGVTGELTGEYLEFGYPVRNLITLQTLDILVDELGGGTAG